jgi:hypothetical protein
MSQLCDFSLKKEGSLAPDSEPLRITHCNSLAMAPDMGKKTKFLAPR